jgi:hypothetical protein
LLGLQRLHHNLTNRVVDQISDHGGQVHLAHPHRCVLLAFHADVHSFRATRRCQPVKGSRDFGALETTAADQDFLVELRGFEPMAIASALRSRAIPPKDEFLLAATAQNLRKLANLIPFRRRSSPHEAQQPSFASLTGAADTHRGRLKRAFFNEIRALGSCTAWASRDGNPSRVTDASTGLDFDPGAASSNCLPGCKPPRPKAIAHRQALRA